MWGKGTRLKPKPVGACERHLASRRRIHQLTMRGTKETYLMTRLALRGSLYRSRNRGILRDRSGGILRDRSGGILRVGNGGILRDRSGGVIRGRMRRLLRR